MNHPNHTQPNQPPHLRLVEANDQGGPPTPAQLVQMSQAELATHPIEALHALHEDAKQAVENAKRYKAALDEVLALKYDEAISRVRQMSNKPTGIVRIQDGDHTIISDVPKRPAWDQKQLAEIATRIQASGDDPAEYMETTYKVPENRFKSWPSSIRETFLPARTLKVGKTTYRVEKSKGAA